jgi:glycine/D-amino acid oxidase-like deaminating enzyme
VTFNCLTKCCVGAGVTGLTTAICLLRNGYKDVKVVAKHVPGDMSSEYTSPWAGASILTVAKHDDYRLQGKKHFLETISLMVLIMQG